MLLSCSGSIDRFSNLTRFVRILFLYVVDFRDLMAHTMCLSSFRLYLILSEIEIQAEIDAIYFIVISWVCTPFPFLADKSC